jgi:hypothetical protein
MSIKERFSGLQQLGCCPDFIQDFWECTLFNEEYLLDGISVDDTYYEEDEDILIFIFYIHDNDRKIYPELIDVDRVSLWETPEGLIGYKGIQHG